MFTCRAVYAATLHAALYVAVACRRPSLSLLPGGSMRASIWGLTHAQITHLAAANMHASAHDASRQNLSLPLGLGAAQRGAQQENDAQQAHPQDGEQRQHQGAHVLQGQAQQRGLRPCCRSDRTSFATLAQQTRTPTLRTQPQINLPALTCFSTASWMWASFLSTPCLSQSSAEAGGGTASASTPAYPSRMKARSCSWMALPGVSLPPKRYICGGGCEEVREEPDALGECSGAAEGMPARLPERRPWQGIPAPPSFLPPLAKNSPPCILFFPRPPLPFTPPSSFQDLPCTCIPHLAVAKEQQGGQRLDVEALAQLGVGVHIHRGQEGLLQKNKAASQVMT